MVHGEWPEHTIGTASVQFAGRQGNPFQQPTALRQMLGLQPGYGLCILQPPTDYRQFGMVQYTAQDQEVIVSPSSFGRPGPAKKLLAKVFKSDGAVVPNECILVAPTRDCPYVILAHEGSGIVVVLHAGRDQIFTDRDSIESRSGVIASGVKVFEDGGIRLDEVRALIIGGISAKHFRHDQHPRREHIKNIFTAHCGEGVFVENDTVALDLRLVLKIELERYGVSKGAITIDQTCPYTNPRFGSMRGQAQATSLVQRTAKELSNWIVVRHE